MLVDRTATDSRGALLKHDGSAWRKLHLRVVSEIVEAVAAIRGAGAGEILRTNGLEALHTVIDPRDFGPLRDRVLERLRPALLKMAVDVGRRVMGWTGEFYVDDYLILRINLPYDVARLAEAQSENPGIGRVSPSVRAAAAARRVKDPVYDPAAYHNGLPPAAWAHGPHVDSWAGHSKDGLNIWWAMGDVPAQAGMVLYPELAGETPPCDRRTLYLQGGYPLPPPTFLPLSAGEMLVFDPEILHGTHLNVTGQTRVAVSLRLNAVRPVFDPDCFYAREFWRRASDIEAGRFETILHLKREENLSAPSPASQAATAGTARTVEVDPPHGAGPVLIGPSSLLRDGERVAVSICGRRTLLMRVAGRLFAVDARCPHYGVDLMDGGATAASLHCPACAVAFDIETGLSASPNLKLERFAVREEGGAIYMDLSA